MYDETIETQFEYMRCLTNRCSFICFICLHKIYNGECNEVILVENFLKMDFTDEQWDYCQERVSQVKRIVLVRGKS